MKGAVMRVARACRDLDVLVVQYTDGLGFTTLSRWRDHEGYDGAILGHPRAAYHLEFIHAHREPSPPAPHKEQLLVFYVDDADAWQARCGAMTASGFAAVTSDNPYWERNGRTFRDAEGGRVVLHRGAWTR